jgi:hypothetical protein
MCRHRRIHLALLPDAALIKALNGSCFNRGVKWRLSPRVDGGRAFCVKRQLYLGGLVVRFMRGLYREMSPLLVTGRFFMSYSCEVTKWSPD